MSISVIDYKMYLAFRNIKTSSKCVAYYREMMADLLRCDG